MQRCTFPKPTRWLVLLLLVILPAGCGEKRPVRVPVSGQVLIDGKPLGLGFIRFVPADARASGGPIGPDGRFTLTCYDGEDGAVVGTHRIEVAAGEDLGERTKRWHAPKKYADVATSGLTQEITGPTDALVVELTWDGGAPFVEQFQPEPGMEGIFK